MKQKIAILTARKLRVRVHTLYFCAAVADRAAGLSPNRARATRFNDCRIERWEFRRYRQTELTTIPLFMDLLIERL
jgi:hypothetical protein